MINDILIKENILLNCMEEPKEAVIRRMGKLLADSGYVNENYIEGMLKREDVFSTNIGNGIALPHGVEEAKRDVLKSGIGIMIFPNGTPWNEERVKVVIGVAGVGDAHLDILAKIALMLSECEQVNRMIDSDVDTIYQMFA